VTKILILGGTAEAVSLAGNLGALGKYDLVYSLAGRTRAPNLPDCEVRRGGFGGAQGLAAYLVQAEITILIDATHPYAATMAANSRRAAQESGIAHFKFLRPAWEVPEGAEWIHVAGPEQAASVIGDRFHRIFLSSGLKDVGAFAELADCWFLIRSIEKPEAEIPLVDFDHILSRGPFDLAAETKLLGDYAIDALVSKNSGGGATSAKLQAAQDLRLPVIMIDRPPAPRRPVYDDPQKLIAAIISAA
jgi:precorrin-6A/cobalt-precorrin-6A reductase